MFCKKCGKDVNDEAVICVHCGCSLEKKSLSVQNTEGAVVFSQAYLFLFLC